MLKFLKEHSYEIVKMYINQLAIALFGLSLAFATSLHGSATGEIAQTYSPNVLQIVTSVLSVLFYLFLIYIMMWDLGAKSSGAIARGEEGFSRLGGLYMGLAASTVNILLAILITLGMFLSDISFFSSVGGVSSTIALLSEGMYIGLLAIRVNDIPLNSLWFMWFVIILPLLLTSTVAYYAGTKEFKIFSKADLTKRQ